MFLHKVLKPVFNGTGKKWLNLNNYIIFRWKNDIECWLNWINIVPVNYFKCRSTVAPWFWNTLRKSNYIKRKTTLWKTLNVECDSKIPWPLFQLMNVIIHKWGLRSWLPWGPKASVENCGSKFPYRYIVATRPKFKMSEFDMDCWPGCERLE